MGGLGAMEEGEGAGRERKRESDIWRREGKQRKINKSRGMGKKNRKQNKEREWE